MNINSISNIDRNIFLVRPDDRNRQTKSSEIRPEINIVNNSDKSRAYSDQARELNSHSIKLDIEASRILRGEIVSAANRINLEGVNAEYLSNMSDAEYITALRSESAKYSSAAIELHRKAHDLDDPNGKAERDAKLTGKPSLADAEEVRSILSSYTDTLAGLIKTRNLFQAYLESDDAREYLTARFGEEGAREQVAQIKQTIVEHDKQIEATITSLNVIFSLNGIYPIAEQQNGYWTMNGTKGSYIGIGQGVQFSFSVTEDGTVGNT